MPPSHLGFLFGVGAASARSGRFLRTKSPGASEAKRIVRHNGLAPEACKTQALGGCPCEGRRRCQGTNLRCGNFLRVSDQRLVWRTEALCLSRGIISADRSANHRFDHNCGHDSLSEHPFPNRGARAPNQGYGLAGLLRQTGCPGAPASCSRHERSPDTLYCFSASSRVESPTSWPPPPWPLRSRSDGSDADIPSGNSWRRLVLHSLRHHSSLPPRTFHGTTPIRTLSLPPSHPPLLQRLPIPRHLQISDTPNVRAPPRPLDRNRPFPITRRNFVPA